MGSIDSEWAKYYISNEPFYVMAGSWLLFPGCLQTFTTVWAPSSLKLWWLFCPLTSSAMTPLPRTALLLQPAHRPFPQTAWFQMAIVACRTCEIAQPARGGERRLYYFCKDTVWSWQNRNGLDNKTTTKNEESFEKAWWFCSLNEIGIES